MTRKIGKPEHGTLASYATHREAVVAIVVVVRVDVAIHIKVEIERVVVIVDSR